LVATNVACRLLDRMSGQCSNYRHRHAFVSECVRLTMANVRDIDWLPATCAYRLRAAGERLPDWHYLVCGDREAVRSEAHTSELQSLMRISYAGFCLKKK